MKKNKILICCVLFMSYMVSFLTPYTAIAASAELVRKYAVNETYDGATVPLGWTGTGISTGIAGDEMALSFASRASSENNYTKIFDTSVSMTGEVTMEIDFYIPSYEAFPKGLNVWMGASNKNTIRLLFINTKNGGIIEPNEWKECTTARIPEKTWYSFRIEFNTSTGEATVLCGQKGTELSIAYTYTYADDYSEGLESFIFRTEEGVDNQAAIYIDNLKVYTEKEELLTGITVSDKRYSVNEEKNIVYIDSEDITSYEFFERLYTNAESMTVYTDATLERENPGFLKDQNVVVLTKGNESRCLTVRLQKNHSMDENFENIQDDPSTLVNDLRVYNNLGENGSISIAEENGNKRLKLYGKYVSGGKRDIILDTSFAGVYLPTVFSFDYDILDNANLDIVITDADSNRKYIMSQEGENRYYFSGTKNPGNPKKGRIAIKFVPDSGKILVYQNGLVTGTIYNDFNFSNFYIRFGFTVPDIDGIEAEAFLDNVKIYEDKSMDENYAVEYPKLYQNSKKLSSLQYGDSTVKLTVEPLISTPEDILSVISVCSQQRVLKVMTTELECEDNGILSCDYDISLDYNLDSYLNVYVWDSNMKPLFKSSAHYPTGPYAPSKEEVAEYINTQRPRLLANNDVFAQIKQKVAEDEEFAAIYDEFIARADRIATYSSTLPKKYDTPEEEYYLVYKKFDGVRILNFCGRARDFLRDLGLAYKLEGDEKYAKKAAEILEIVCGDAFPDWNPSHFLDVAAMTEGVAIGYDWFYDYLSDKQKELVKNAIITKGLNEGVKGYEEGHIWTNCDYNWNPACNKGLLYGAIAVYEDYQEHAADLISNTIKNIPIAMKTAYPGGSWFEGPTYGTAVAFDMADTTETLINCFGTDFGYKNTPGLEQFAEYIMHVNGPCGVNNYSDCDEHTTNSEALYWLAETYNKPHMSEMCRKGIQVPTTYSILWYNKGEEQGYDLDAYFPDTELVTMRGNENMSEGFWLSFCGGDSIITHSHLDCGSFVLDYNANRFASDLGADDYNLPNYRFDAYRTRAEGHNTLVINPDTDGGQIEGFAEVAEKSLNCDNPYAIVNLSNVYDVEDATFVRRGFMMQENRNSVVIRDEIELSKQSDVYWFMHTKADDVKISDNEAIITIGDDKLKLEFITDAEDAEISFVEAKPFDTSPVVEGQNSNSDYGKIQIKLSGDDSVNITVRITPINYTANTSLSDLHSYKLADWREMK